MGIKVWTCKVVVTGDLPRGADKPMRSAVRHAVFDMTGAWPLEVSSGWSGHLTEAEMAAMEGREPDPHEVIAEIDEEIARLTTLRASAISYLEEG